MNTLLVVVIVILVIAIIWRTIVTKNKTMVRNEFLEEISIQNDIQTRAIQKFLGMQQEQILLGQENARLLEEINTKLEEEKVNLTPQEVVKLIDDVEVVSTLNDTIEVTEVEQ